MIQAAAADVAWRLVFARNLLRFMPMEFSIILDWGPSPDVTWAFFTLTLNHCMTIKFANMQLVILIVMYWFGQGFPIDKISIFECKAPQTEGPKWPGWPSQRVGMASGYLIFSLQWPSQNWPGCPRAIIRTSHYNLTLLNYQFAQSCIFSKDWDVIGIIDDRSWVGDH